MKKRRFAAGGETSFSPEQEAWLGGADRTDPYILARMRRAVPDTPNRAPVEDRTPTPVVRSEPKEAERAAPAALSAEERQERSAPKASAPRVSAPVVSERPRRTKLYQAAASDERGEVDMSAYKPRSENAARPLTQDALLAQIPTGGSGKGPTESEGNSASGSELGRNISNTLAALPGMGGIRAAQTAASVATAGRAAKTASEAVKNRERVTNPLYWMAGPKNASKFDGSAAAAKVAAKPAAKPAAKAEKAAEPSRDFSKFDRDAAGSAKTRQMRAADTGPKLPPAAKTTAAEKAKLAGELRSAHNPTKFSTSSKAKDFKNTRFKEDEAGIEFKRGGPVQKYAKGGSVKGWGQARGARSAKIV